MKLKKTIASIILIALIMQAIMILIPEGVLAVENTREKAEQESQEVEIGREYEIKEEETWDVSTKQDGSVMAKWTLKDRTLVISGNGKMKDYNYNDSNIDWHGSQYTNIIEKAIIEKGITSIGAYAFYECSSLTNIEIPESITSIEDSAFKGCSSLTNIEVPEEVTNIGERAFEECASLSNIEIPKGVFNIKYSTFLGCSSLVSIKIPAGINEISDYAFLGCSSLESINVDANNKKYTDENGILFNKNKTKLLCYPNGKKDVKEYIIPKSVTSIGENAFYKCSSLTNIEIPDGVTSIGDSAFYKCSNLTNIEIPKTVKQIGNWMFSECSSLTKIEIPDGIINIGWRAFEGCSSLMKVKIPESVMSIKGEAFIECINLKKIEILAGITNIETRAFEHCDNLILYTKADSVVHQYAEENGIAYILEGIAKNVKTNYIIKEKEEWDISENKDGSIIAKWTLQDKTLNILGNGKMKDWNFGAINIDWHYSKYTNIIENVIIETGVTNIGDRAFNVCSNLKSVEIPESITNIGEAAFRKCSSLTNIEIPKGVTSIGEEAFYDCSKLTNIKIPEGVTNIGYETFRGCSSLINIEIPEGVTNIELNAFKGCSSLTNITIPAGVNEISNYPFLGCSSLESINVDANNKKYTDENGILFNKNKTEILCYPEGKKDVKEYKIPEGVTSIETGTFEGCRNLINIAIPEGVTSIKSMAFSGCSSLTNIKIPEGVTSIGSSAFSGCSSLTNIIIPEGVTVIENSTFEECSSLTNITISEGVTSIGVEAFERCSSLTNITIPKGVMSIEYSTFEGCSSLTNIEIPDSVTSIKNDAFRGVRNIIVKKNTLPHRYAEEEKIGYLIDEEGPEIIYTPSGEKKPRKQYQIQIKVEDIKTEVNENSLRYQWTQSTETPNKESFKEILKNGQTITKNNGNGIWYLWVYAEDKLGNVTIKRSEGYNFDNTVPNIEVKYNTIKPTNENIRVTIVANEEIQGIEGWDISENEKELTKEYVENIEETVIIKDIAGNQIDGKIVIKNIDKVPPKLEIKYSTKNPTRENVTVTITSNEEIQEIEGWKMSENKKEITKEYTENKEETVVIKDKLGNQTEAKVSIKNIDKVKPVVEIKYSTINPTRENVKVTITANEEIQEIEGWEMSENKKEITKEYTENKEETVVIKDKLGNQTEAKVSVKNIDKIKPVVEVKYSTINPTRENVTVTIVANEEIQEIEGWEMSENKKEITKEYVENVEETLTVKDKAGNITQVKIIIKNILPKIQIGDINGDKKIDITDLLLLKRHIIAGNKEEWKLTGEKLQAGDINEDGEVNITDMLLLKREIIGKV